jgi:virulence factor Mce-like protein
MIRRRPNKSAFGSPVLIGAVTVLILLVGVFLAYNANVGLPFVPTRTLYVDIQNGSDLVNGNDVLVSGDRIGYVQSMQPVRLPSGAPVAQLKLALNESHGKIPVDSTATILSRSVLGLKYVNITLGKSSHDFADDGTMPITQTTVPVRIDQLYGTYTPKTRVAIQQNLLDFGDVLGGRGSAINDTIAALPSLLGHLTPVAEYLTQPSTDLTGFLQALDNFTTTVAPYAQTNVSLLSDAATTLEAISSNKQALEHTISEAPSTLQEGTESLHAQEPFLVDLTTLGGDLSPATKELNAALPDTNSAIEAGTKTLKRTPALDTRLQGVMGSLKNLAQAPSTGVALNALTDTVDTLNPMVEYLGPFVTVCNDWNYWWTNIAGDLDETTDFGFAQRALANLANPAQTNSVLTQGATAPVDGGVPNIPAVGGDAYAHGPVYGAAVDSQGNADCETGQRGYPQKLNYFDPQGRDLDTDDHTPGDQGSTFTGAAHVPKGETFTRAPTTGPVAPVAPDNQ